MLFFSSNLRSMISRTIFFNDGHDSEGHDSKDQGKGL